MSRSQPTAVNPATRFFSWKGGSGQLEFYDKEQEKRINVPLPFEFLPLDELATITGYSKQEKSGFWSNEVRSTVNDELTVRTKNGVRYTGMYKNEQGIAQMPKGASYAKSIYMAYKTRDGWQIGNIKANGSALGAWIEFGSQYKTQNGKVTITRGEEQESPVGTFYPPVFTYSSCTSEENGIGIALDRELQTYLNIYLAAAEFNRTNQADDDIVIEDVDQAVDLSGTQQAVENWEAGQEQANTAKPARQWNKVGRGGSDDDQAIEDYKQAVDTELGNIEGEQINLDDIPF